MAALFRHIRTEGYLPGGRTIHSHYSFPLGVLYSVYAEINRKMVVAYGPQNCKVIGEYLCPPSTPS